MTTIPMPNTPTAGFKATYDAWNRLVELQSGSSVVAKYAYSVRRAESKNRQRNLLGGAVAETGHFYHNDRWQ